MSYQASKPNKVARLPEVAPLPLPEALALYMKKRRVMLVKLLKYVVERSNVGLSYFILLLASADPLPLLLPLPLPLPLPFPLSVAAPLALALALALDVC
jgi:hypothetical protein